MSNRKRGLLFIVSAPSGTGKTTLAERLVQRVPNLCLSRSYTSRAARPGEQDGVDYNFISRARFEEMARRGEFLEWADVFGNYYGTCADDTERCPTLEQRLRGRSKDSEEEIRKRLDAACREVTEFATYEYVVVNDELDGAVERLRAIVQAERSRVKAMR